MNGTEAALSTKVRLAGVQLVVCAAVLFSSISVLVGSATANDTPGADLQARASAIAAAQNLSCTVEPRFVDTVIVARAGGVEVVTFDTAMRALSAGDAAVLQFCS